MNFFFRNRIIFWTFQNKIEDKQTETEGVNFYKEIKFTLLEEISWRQKSRVLQLREGDSNTRFFHKMANSNRRNNGIKNLRVNGSLSSNKNLIVNCITQFFMALYSEQQVDWHFPDVLEFPTISRDNASWVRDLLRRQRYLKSLRISMVTNRLGQMVFPWHF